LWVDGLVAHASEGEWLMQCEESWLIMIVLGLGEKYCGIWWSEDICLVEAASLQRRLVLWCRLSNFGCGVGPCRVVTKYRVRAGVARIDSDSSILMLSRTAGSYKLSQLSWKFTVVAFRIEVGLSKK
jgi:hypothetical protein